MHGELGRRCTGGARSFLVRKIRLRCCEDSEVQPPEARNFYLRRVDQTSNRVNERSGMIALRCR